jgi:hypothetical protein
VLLVQALAAACSSGKIIVGNSGQDINLMEEEQQQEEEMRMAWIMTRLQQMKKKLECSCKKHVTPSCRLQQCNNSLDPSRLSVRTYDCSSSSSNCARKIRA